MLHKYPGVNLDLRHYPQGNGPVYPIGAHHNCWGANSELLPVREVFMVTLMDRLTDKVDWHKKVLDEEIVAKWRKETLEQPEDELYLQIIDEKISVKIPKPRGRIISEAAFDYCIKELRVKAAHFENTGLVHTLDSASNTVVKSDTAVTSELQEDLRSAFDQLCVDQASDVDWHPGSSEMVQDLVHPSMYPFIYGRSNFLQEEVVGVSDAIELWTGKGETVPEKGEDVPVEPEIAAGFCHWELDSEYQEGGSTVPPEYWSSKYQWLPANLAFQEDGTVKFTSYINNLHPKKYPHLYRTIERLIDTSIPAWDQCLSKYKDFKRIGAGRQESRFSQPESCEEDNDALWEPFNADVLAQHDFELSRYDLKNLARAGSGDGPVDGNDVEQFKWKRIRDPILPEPDDETCIDYRCHDSLREAFKATGLQVIVKMATIELTPEKPDFPIGGWHIEGQMNERICATALYYLDSENVTSSHLSFRMQTSPYQDDLQDIAGQDDYNWLERVYGTALSSSGACLQHYGSVETRQGRLLAFPNVFQHRVSPFKLQDPTKPGHRRFIALWLVDPHQRIISTANVPPQQLDWSTGSVPSTDNQAEHSEIAPEVLGTVPPISITPKGLMTVEEARQHRLELIIVRTRFHEVSEDDWKSVEYSFCEH